MTQFYQAFPCISTASNKCWCKKAWGRRLEEIRGKLIDENLELEGDKQDHH